MLVSSSFLMLNCTPNSKSVVDDLSFINIATIMNTDSWPMPELSEKEAHLVDSISKLKEYVNYHKAYQQLIQKTKSYFASLTPKELEELAKNGSDAAFLSEFMRKMKSCIDIKKELDLVEKTERDFDEIITGLELTEAEKIALIIKKFK